MSTSISPAVNIIEVRQNKPMVSSVKIAEIFERPHKNVLRVLRELSADVSANNDENRSAQKGGVPKRGRGRNTEISAGVLKGKISWSTYQDDHGREQPIAWLSEREALIAMPFFGGRKAHDGQRKLVDAYLWYRDNFANPPRKDILAAKRAAHHPMMDALIEFREEAGKDTDARHFMCENKLVNWVVTGVFAKIDEAALSNDQVELLRQVRERNAAFLLAGLDYDTRKAKLAQFAMRARTKLLGVQA